jgi:hypothetical protein
VRTLYLALVHYPVLNQVGENVTATITNLDVHDIARSCKTYGAEAYYLIHPVEQQRTLVRTICEHWTTGASAARIPDRKNALAIVRTASSLAEMYSALGDVEVWVTSAKATPSLSWQDARTALTGEGKPVVLLFGTSWGLAGSVMQSAQHTLPALRGEVNTGFNHLSVRSACALTLDRLRGAP